MFIVETAGGSGIITFQTFIPKITLMSSGQVHTGCRCVKTQARLELGITPSPRSNMPEELWLPKTAAG